LRTAGFDFYVLGILNKGLGFKVFRVCRGVTGPRKPSYLSKCSAGKYLIRQLGVRVW